MKVIERARVAHMDYQKKRCEGERVDESRKVKLS